MKKIFLIAVVLLMMINFIINYQHEVTKETAYTDGGFQDQGRDGAHEGIQ